ncbi:MAG: hypothetical protein U0V74_06005 [Chitinophagales bacterium]
MITSFAQKKLLFLFVLIALLTQCRNKKAETSLEAADNYSMYLGGWVKEGFITDLAQSKSPFKSRKELGGILELNFLRDSQESGSINISYGNHESGDIRLIMKGDSSFLLVHDYSDLFSGDTMIYFRRINDTIEVISKKQKVRYIKILNEVKRFSNEGVYWVVNKMLFPADYRVISDQHLKPLEKVTFKPDGTILNFPPYYSYEVHTDFIGVEDTTDYISFFDSTGKESVWQYSISDTIYFTNTTGPRFLLVPFSSKNNPIH